MRRPSVTALCDALEANAVRAAALMRLVTDPTPGAVGTWTIGDTAAHVSGSAASFLSALRHEVEPERLSEVDASNALALAAIPERDPRVLADRLVAGETALAAYARHVDGDPVVSPFEGVEVPLSTVLGVELGELLVHGHDIARAAGLAWEISDADARLALQAYLPLLPHMLHADRAAGVEVAVDIRVRGMQPAIARIAGGELTVEEADHRPVDLHISVDPVVYLLLTWNRIAPWKPMLRGRLLLWGRRPWRMNEFAALVAA